MVLHVPCCIFFEAFALARRPVAGHLPPLGIVRDRPPVRSARIGRVDPLRGRPRGSPASTGLESGKAGGGRLV